MTKNELTNTRAWILAAALLGALTSPESGWTATQAEASAPPLIPASYEQLKGYLVRVWGPEESQPLGAATGFARTEDGYLWIGTHSGLLRFDGHRFVPFNSRNTSALANEIITKIAPDGRDGLWLATAGGGLIRKTGDEFERFGASQGLSNEVINAILPDSSGGVWVGTAGGGVQRFMDGEFEQPLQADDDGARMITALAWGPDGAPWVGDAKGKVWSAGSTGLQQVAGTGELSDEVTALFTTAAGEVLIGTSRRLFRWRDGQLDNVTLPSAEPDGEYVSGIVEDQAGFLWIATLGNGVARIDSAGRVQRLTTESGLPGSAVEAVHFDASQGLVWLGIRGAGVALLRQPSFTSLEHGDGLEGEIILPIIEDEDRTVWFGTFGNGLHRWRNGNVSVITEADGLPSGVILSLAIDPSGTLWVGTRRGLAAVTQGEVRLSGPETGAPEIGVNPLYADSRGSLWLGTATGLLVIREDSVAQYSARNGFSDTRASVVLEDRAGRIWIGTEGDGLFRFANDSFHQVTAADGLGDDVIWALHEDQDGLLWVGTNSAGLAVLSPGGIKNVTESDGLPGRQAFRILEDESGHLWISSARGIAQLRRGEVLDYLSGIRRDLGEIGFFDQSYGMPTSEVNGGIQPAGWRRKNGELWFPTIRGLAIIDPSRAAGPVPWGPLLLEGVRVNGEELAGASEQFTLAPGVDRMEFDYTAPHFLAPEEVEFSYRLDGLDQEWTSAGDRRTAYYTNLRPGSYRFRVRARTPWGEWKELNAPVSFRVRPHYYQTPAFYFAILAVFLGLIMAGHRIRVRALKKKELVLMELVSERQLAERKYRDLFENASDMVFTMDLQGSVTSINKQGTAITELPKKEIIGRRLQELVAPEDRSTIDTLLNATRRDGIAADFSEVRFSTASSKPHIVEINTRLIREEGEAVGIQAIGRDITRRHELEEQLQQSQKLQMVGQLAGGVAHDFNNLLTAMLGSATTLREEVSDPSLRSEATEITRAVDRGAALTRQMLLFSRQEVSSPQVVDVNDLLRDMQGLLRRSISEDIDLVTELDLDAGCVFVDSMHLEQVVLNLVVNARDAMSGGGRIVIGTSRSSVGSAIGPDLGESDPTDFVVIYCKDSGHGMSEAVKSRIFDPFYTTKAPGKGTGLGLSTVYGIIQAAKGWIDVLSPEGKGSTFRVYLPAALAPPTEIEFEPERASETVLPRTVLLVEDDVSVRNVVSRFLKRRGVDVIEAPDGAAALNLWNEVETRVEIVITDLVMPRMGGTDLVARLREKKPELKVLLLSGYSNHPSNRATAEIPTDRNAAFLEKPFSMEMLLAQLSGLLTGTTPPKVVRSTLVNADLTAPLSGNRGFRPPIVPTDSAHLAPLQPEFGVPVL